MKFSIGVLFSLFLVSALAYGCAPSSVKPANLSLKDDVPRVSGSRARFLVKAGRALLVCAYEDEDRCAEVGPKGSISLMALRSRASGLARTRTLIFFCNCVGDSTAIHVAKAFRNRGFVNARVLRGGTTAWTGRSDPVLGI